MRRRGFTLIELLVVVAIIALLIAILLPSLARAKEKAKTAKCLANTRAMGTAVQFYVADWQKMIPFTGATGDSWTQVLRGVKGSGGYGAIDKVRICPTATIANQTGVPWWGTAHYAWGNSEETGPDPVTGQPLISSYGLNGYLYNASPPAAIATIGDGNTAGLCHHLPLGSSESSVPVFVDCIWRHVLPLPGDKPGANLEDPGPNSLTSHPISKIMINRHNKAVNVSFMDGHADTVNLPDLYELKWYKCWVPPATISPIPVK